MTTQDAMLNEIRGRLIKLERQNRRVKQFGVIALIVAASLVFMAQGSPKKIVDANEFILKDASGNVRARLSMNASLASPELLLLDDKGNSRVKLDGGIGPIGFIGGHVSVFDGQGRERGVFSADDNTGAFLSLLDSKGLPTASFTKGQVVAKEFMLKDDTGNIRARLFMSEKVTTQATTDSAPMTLDPTATLAFYQNKEKQPGIALSGDGYINAKFYSVSDPQGKMVGNFGSIGGYGSILRLQNLNDDSTTYLEAGHLDLTDGQGFKATLGMQELTNPRTGETRGTSAASLTLFDKDKNVIWKAP